MSSNELYALLRIGDITVSGAGSSVKALNDILVGAGIAVGVIIITVAIIKLIIGLAQERPDQTSQASLMFGVGAIFVSITKVMSILQLDSINSDTTANVMAVRVLNIIAALLNIAGIIIAVIAIVYLIMAMANEQPESKMTGSKLLMLAVGFLSAQALADRMAIRITSKTTGAMSYIYDVVGFIANVASYAGAAIFGLGIWYFIDSLKSEDAKERDHARRFLMVGVALVGVTILLTKVFGFTPTKTF